jgi:hypothetical protein
VRRVDRGWVWPRLWRQQRGILALELGHWQGQAELRPLAAGRWSLHLWQ